MIDKKPQLALWAPQTCIVHWELEVDGACSWLSWEPGRFLVVAPAPCVHKRSVRAPRSVREELATCKSRRTCLEGGTVWARSQLELRSLGFNLRVAAC